MRALRGIAAGLRWLAQGHHPRLLPGLRSLPERLGYLVELEAAHVAQGQELAQVTAAAEERLRALEAEQAARRVVERGAALVLAQADAQKAIAETHRKVAEELQRRIHAAQAEGRKAWEGHGEWSEALTRVLAALEGRKP